MFSQGTSIVDGTFGNANRILPAFRWLQHVFHFSIHLTTQSLENKTQKIILPRTIRHLFLSSLPISFRGVVTLVNN